LEISS